MRAALTLMVVVACGSQQTGVELESGPLISVTEGDAPRHIHVTGAAKLTTSPDVTWASFDGSSGDLVIAPPCTAVPGTSGAPRLFYMQLDSTDVVVQVQPSAAGKCAPSLRACLVTADCTPASMPTCAPQSALGHVLLPVSYASATDPDQTLVFTIENPDPTVALGGHITTDAPIKFRPNSDSTSFCAYMPNSNIAGDFTLDWTIAVAPVSPDAAMVSSGEYHLDWNADDAYDIEVEWCATDGTSCTLHRYTAPSPLPNAQWCIDHKPMTAVGMTLGLRIWARSMMGMDSYRLTLGAKLGSATKVTLTSSTRRLPDALDLDLDRMSVPAEVTADLSTPPASDRLTLTLGPASAPSSRTVEVAIMATCPPGPEQPHARAAR
ncbi:MAG: hypothetical protein ABJE66_14235 [Deltaproteobacteria bacterium]